MSTQFDLEKAKQQLSKLSKEASQLAKKGEEQLIKLSSRGKLHFDSTAAGLKLEQLYYLIGKEYVSHSGHRTAKMTQLLDQHKKVTREQKSLKAKLDQKS